MNENFSAKSAKFFRHLLICYLPYAFLKGDLCPHHNLSVIMLLV